MLGEEWVESHRELVTARQDLGEPLRNNTPTRSSRRR